MNYKSFKIVSSVSSQSVNKAMPKPESMKSALLKSSPWVIGAGLAFAHMANSSNCTIPQQGRCTSCGSCVLALVALVGWAIFKKNDGELYQKKEL